MSGKFSRWLRSKAGTYTIIGIAAVLAVIVAIGAVFGWWADLVDLITGTVVSPPPLPQYPAPKGGYTCLPTCYDGVTDYDGDGTPEPQDGKMFSSVGADMASFGGSQIVLWIGVSGDSTNFEIGIFDGDSGKNNAGTVNYRNGNWDNTNTEATYTLYADPLKDGRGNTVVGVWRGNQDPMPNNAWYTVSVNNTLDARGPSGHYFYRLEITRPAEGSGINAFKLRSTGYLSTGQSDLVDANVSVVGMMYGVNDARILCPQWQSVSNPGQCNYNGEWLFHFYVPTDTNTLSIWDGDFDRGTSATEAPDTDDPNTPNTLPPFKTNQAQPEGVGGTYLGTPGKGAPSDNYDFFPLYKREPAVWYEFIDPAGVPIYTNGKAGDGREPSGTEEWEHFVISTDRNIDADLVTDAIKPGFYGMAIHGLDHFNTVWIRMNYQICDAEDGCGPPTCDGSCPRTIGYWKNNVRKWLEAGTGTPRGVQETRESLEAGLRLTAQQSGFYCNGMNVRNPVVMTPCNPLTLQEANVILQRDQKTYPGGKDAANSMLARALQQNLATWLNMMTGKICKDTTTVVIKVPSGTFQGTLWAALQEARTIILNKDTARMERAKDIADLINNAQINVDPSDVLACSAYTAVVPPDKQPPPYKELPEAPLPSPPPPPVIGCPAGQVCPTCTGNPCNSIFSPGYWKNYSNHYTDAEFLALIQKTPHYSGLTINGALAILNNNADQYHRHLLSAELNVAANPGLGAGLYKFGDGSGLYVLQVLDEAYNTDPANADAALTDAVLYLGAKGEGQGNCRVSCSP